MKSAVLELVNNLYFSRLPPINKDGAPIDRLTTVLADFAVIDVPPDISRQRIISRGAPIEMYETEERLRPVYANYLELVEQCRREGERVITVDGRLAIGVVAATILQRTLAIINAPRTQAPAAG